MAAWLPARGPSSRISFCGPGLLLFSPAGWFQNITSFWAKSVLPFRAMCKGSQKSAGETNGNTAFFGGSLPPPPSSRHKLIDRPLLLFRLGVPLELRRNRARQSPRKVRMSFTSRGVVKALGPFRRDFIPRLLRLGSQKGPRLFTNLHEGCFLFTVPCSQTVHVQQPQIGNLAPQVRMSNLNPPSKLTGKLLFKPRGQLLLCHEGPSPTQNN